jgi:hypothetical protein
MTWEIKISASSHSMRRGNFQNFANSPIRLSCVAGAGVDAHLIAGMISWSAYGRFPEMTVSEWVSVCSVTGTYAYHVLEQVVAAFERASGENSFQA